MYRPASPAPLTSPPASSTDASTRRDARRLARRPAHRLRRRRRSTSTRTRTTTPGLAGRARRRPGAAHRRAPRRPARCGRPTAASWRSRRAVARRRTRRRSTCCRSTAPARCAPSPRCPTASPTSRGRPTAVAGVHQPHPRRPLRGQGRALAAAAQDRDVLHPPRQRGLDRSTARSTSTSCAPTAPAPSRNLTPGPFQHDGVVVAGRLVRRRHRGAAPRRLGPRPRRGPLRRAARRRDPRPHEADRRVRHAVGLARRLDASPSSASTTRSIVPAERQGRRDRRRRRRPPLDLRRRSTARSRRPPACGRRCGSTTTRCWPPPRTAATPTCTGSPSTDRRRRSRSRNGPLTRARRSTPPAGASPWPRPTVEHPAEIVTLDGPVTAVTRSVPRLGEVRRADAPTAPTRSTPGSCARPGFEAAPQVPGAAQRPRRPVHAVRRDVLRRGPDAGRGRVRRRDVATPAAAAAATRRGARRSSGPSTRRCPAPAGARSTSTTCSPCSTPRSTATAFCDRRPRRHARRQLRRLHGDAARRPPRRPVPGHLQRAGGQQPAVRGVVAATSARRSASSTGRRTSRTPTSTRGCRRSADVRDIDVPMLILHSEDDLRCPIIQAEELFVALRLLGKDVTFYRFPGESHELSRSGSPRPPRACAPRSSSTSSPRSCSPAAASAADA